MKQCGLLLGLVLLLAVCGMNTLSLHFMLQCAEQSGAKSYLEMGRKAFGQRGERAVQLSIVTLTFGAITAYMVPTLMICMLSWMIPG